MIKNDRFSIFEEAMNKSTLTDYICIKTCFGIEKYLLDNDNFYEAHLKFKCRANILPLNMRVSMYDDSVNSICSLC